MNRATRKPGEHYVIWMTRKMPQSILQRMRLLAVQSHTPLWSIHQQLLHIGVKELERRVRPR